MWHSFKHITMHYSPWHADHHTHVLQKLPGPRFACMQCPSVTRDFINILNWSAVGFILISSWPPPIIPMLLTLIFYSVRIGTDPHAVEASPLDLLGKACVSRRSSFPWWSVAWLSAEASKAPGNTEGRRPKQGVEGNVEGTCNRVIFQRVKTKKSWSR